MAAGAAGAQSNSHDTKTNSPCLGVVVRCRPRSWCADRGGLPRVGPSRSGRSEAVHEATRRVLVVAGLIQPGVLAAQRQGGDREQQSDERPDADEELPGAITLDRPPDSNAGEARGEDEDCPPMSVEDVSRLRAPGPGHDSALPHPRAEHATRSAEDVGPALNVPDEVVEAYVDAAALLVEFEHRRRPMSCCRTSAGLRAARCRSHRLRRRGGC